MKQDQDNFYLVHKGWNGWEEVRNKKTGKLMTWNNRQSCQVAACKMFGIGKDMEELLIKKVVFIAVILTLKQGTVLRFYHLKILF